jgi:hypothetical protein
MLVKSLALASLRPDDAPERRIVAHAAASDGGEAEAGTAESEEVKAAAKAKADAAKVEADKTAASNVTAAMAALAQQIPTDIVTCFTGVFAVVNVSEYGDFSCVRAALVVVGILLTVLYFAGVRAKEGRAQNKPAPFRSTFSGKPRIGLLMLLVSFLLWALLVMSGKQSAGLNLFLVIATPIWIAAQTSIRNLVDL